MRTKSFITFAGSSGGNSGEGGDLLYRWGNPRAYKDKSDQKLFFPHNAHWIPAGLPGAGNVLIYNNGSEHPGFARGYSSVDEIHLPASGYSYTRAAGAAYGPSNPTWTYESEFFAAFISGAQRLPNGNTLVVDGPIGRMREVTRSKDVVWEYVSPLAPSYGILSQGQTQPPNQLGWLLYRAYKYAPDYSGVQALDLIPESDRKPIEKYP